MIGNRRAALIIPWNEFKSLGKGGWKEKEARETYD